MIAKYSQIDPSIRLTFSSHYWLKGTSAWEFPSRELTDDGLRVILRDGSGAAVFTYRRMQ